MPLLTMTGKARVISMNGDPKEQWEEIHSILRNPVITTFEITEDLNLDVKAGMSALCEYSMLEDNPFPTYAITKKEIQKLQIKKKQLVPKGEEKGCVIQELGYYINFQKRRIKTGVVLLFRKFEIKTDCFREIYNRVKKLNRDTFSSLTYRSCMRFPAISSL